MDCVSEIIERQGFVVLDGGLATELEKRGESLNHPLWSAKILLSAPEKISSVHQSYFAAGADVAITSSYQATFPGLQAAGCSKSEADKIIRSSVTVATDARDKFWSEQRNRAGRLRPLVAASVGPYGAFLHDGSEYRGNYGVDKETLLDFHRERLALLAGSGADLLACESIPSLVEAEVLVELLEELNSCQAWLSFTCKDHAHISDGAKFDDVVSIVCQAKSVVAVGLNCTAPGLVNKLLERAGRVTDKPLVAYPNSGEAYEITTCSWQLTGEIGAIEEAAYGWYERGARLIGGCCRTTPETIRGIRKVLTFAPANSENN